MKTITKPIFRIVKFSPAMILMLIFISYNMFSQETSKKQIITVSTTESASNTITYQNIDINQIVDFNNLLRVYINKSSVVMVDNNPIPFDITGEKIKNYIIKYIETNNSNLDSSTIETANSDLALLIRKSSFTSKEDYSSLMRMVTSSIFDVQNYLCTQVYDKPFASLNENQKLKINNLVPLVNFFAQDNTF